MNEDWEFGRVTEEEDGGIVEHPVPIAFFGVEFYREASWVSGGVWRTLLTTHSGKTSHTLGLLPNTIEHIHRSLQAESV